MATQIGASLCDSVAPSRTTVGVALNARVGASTAAEISAAAASRRVRLTPFSSRLPRDRRAAGDRDLRDFLEVLDLESKVEDSLGPPARRNQRKIDVAIGDEDRSALLAPDLGHAERRLIEFCERIGIVRKQSNVPDMWHEQISIWAISATKICSDQRPPCP